VLVGREAELGSIRRLVDGLGDGRGGALLLHGPAGIGKTALLQSAREMAAGATVLECCGVESESSLAFGVLRDLIWPVVERRSGLPTPQRDALAGALALSPPAPGDRLAVCVATLGVLEAAAADGPVLAIVDDVQWLDSPSRECVLYAARRARGPVGLMLAVREGHGHHDLERIPIADLPALDLPAAAELLASRAPDLAPEVREAITQAAAGNPLALLELPATLTDEQRMGSASLDQPLAPGRALDRMYSARLRGLPDAARSALLVAAAGHTDDLAAVDAACRAIGTSAGALEAAETAALVRLDDDRVIFSHPLARGATYHGAPAAERRAAHRALAGVAEGEARAWHLAAAAVGPDEAAAQALEEAGGIAAARRAYAVAADAFERAAHLTSEPAMSAGRLLGAGAAALSAGHPAHAAELAEEASARAVDPLTIASADHLLGVLAMWSGRVVEAMDLLERSADAVASANPAMAALALANASFACSAAGDCRRALSFAERASELIDDSADPAVRAPVLAVLSWCLVLRGETRRARPIVSEAERLAPSVDPLSPAAQVIIISLNCRLPADDCAGALAHCLASASAVREAGSLYALPTPLCIAAEAAYRLGRWDDLEELCDQAIATAEETDQWGPAAQAAIVRARLAAARGLEAECRANAEAGLRLVESAGVNSMAVYGHGALGFLELSAARVEAAIEELEATERLAGECGLEEPTIVPWASDLIEAYVRAGRDEDARRVLATLSRQAELADTSAAAALVERCRGLLTEDGFDEHFALALEHDSRNTMLFERARTMLAWGMRLHRARRRADARERLRAATETFEELGATPWAELASAEFAAAGGRRRQSLADDALTGQEERIARAAAGGATTREIAAELFLSPKTVEWHLGRVYRKLGVQSRAELGAALAETNA
jgi:DNA-binding CsgD family transcriptional regulator/tetratricopeptide (TPR) repeat protein